MLWFPGRSYVQSVAYEQLPLGVLEQVAVASERVWLATARAGVHWDRLLFSAKESVFNAWFPLVAYPAQQAPDRLHRTAFVGSPV